MRRVKYERGNVELTPSIQKVFQVIEELEVVDSLVVKGENTILVEFNKACTWNIIRKPVDIALNYSFITTGLESVSSKTTRYRLVPTASRKAKVQPRRKVDFEVEKLENLERGRNWIAVMGFKHSVREQVSFHESESRAKKWLLEQIRDLPYRGRPEDEELSAAFIARRVAEYEGVGLPLDTERVFYCRDCERFLLDGPERTACRLADHNVLGESSTELRRAGKEVFF